MTDWSSYVAGYHEERPGISEELLEPATDADGRCPYDWLFAAVPEAATTVVDVACGSGPVLRRLTAEGKVAVGVDRSGAELAVARRQDGSSALTRADAGALPLRTGSAAAATVSLGLMVMVPVAAVLHEIARILVPGGLLVATVPVRAQQRTVGDEVFAALLADLGQSATRYPNALTTDDLAGAGLVTTDDARRSFVRTLVDVGDAEMAVRALYAPGASPTQVHAARERLRRRVADGPVEIRFTIRRIVAVRRARPRFGPAEATWRER